MPCRPSGVLHQSIDETPIAVLDFETTGLTPGFDREADDAMSSIGIDPVRRWIVGRAEGRGSDHAEQQRGRAEPPQRTAQHATLHDQRSACSRT